MATFWDDKPWAAFIGGVGLIITIAGGFAGLIVHDVNKSNAIDNLSEKMTAWQADNTAWKTDVSNQLRDINIRITAGAVYPTQIQDIERRDSALERSLDAINVRLQSIDAELVYLRNQSDNNKAAFANIFPRLADIEKKTGPYRGAPP